MKVQVKNLEANPYRDLKKYPVDRGKIQQLKTSIKETTFWDNILARKSNGKVQIAYGHHRLIALRELKIDEVDIPVRKLDDATMLRIMASENLDTWSAMPSIINQDVMTVKKYLDAELAKYKTWDEFRSNKSIRPIIKTEPEFRSVKGKGVGQTTILKFLGGNWKQWMVANALQTLDLDKQKIVDRKAVEEMPKLENANKFKKAIREVKDEGVALTPKQQRSIARRLVKEEVPSRDISEAVREYTGVKKKKNEPMKQPPMLDDYVDTTSGKMSDVSIRLQRISKFVGNIRSAQTKRVFRNECKRLKKMLETIIKEN